MYGFSRLHLGRMGRSFNARHEKHIRSIINKGDSDFASHILNHRYQCGKMEYILDLMDKLKNMEKLLTLKKHQYIFV